MRRLSAEGIGGYIMHNGPELSISEKRRQNSKINGFEISEYEWEAAIAFFMTNENAVKLDRHKYPELKLDHSFYYDDQNHDIIAIKGKHHYVAENKDLSRENDRLIPRGGLGKYRLGISYSTAKVVGVKIMGPNSKIQDELLFNQFQEPRSTLIQRKLDEPKLFISKKGKTIDQKNILIIKHIDGINLTTWLSQPIASDFYPCLIAALNCVYNLINLQNDGILHNDIKTDNIIINEKAETALIDFGFAIQLPEQARYHSVDIKTKRHGTILYMHPEHLLQGLSGYRFDNYSMGIVIGKLIGLPPNALAVYCEMCTQMAEANLKRLNINSSHPDAAQFFNKIQIFNNVINKKSEKFKKEYLKLPELDKVLTGVFTNNCHELSPMEAVFDTLMKLKNIIEAEFDAQSRSSAIMPSGTQSSSTEEQVTVTTTRKIKSRKP